MVRSSGGRGRARARGRARGRGRGHYRDYSDREYASSVSGRSEFVPSTDDEDPNYEDNRKRKESQYCKKVNINNYSSTNKDQDFVIWVNQFEEAVKQQLNPHSKKRHHKQCLKWLPLSLASDAYSIWQRTDHNRTDWVLLRAELEEAFEDTEVRSHWKSDMKAYTWDESQPLRVYRAKVERYVDTFDKDIGDNPTSRGSMYYTRFVNGLPDDYSEYIMLSMPAKCTDIGKALEACLRFQNIKKRKAEKAGKAEVGASASFNDPTVSARVTQNETGILRLEEKVRTIQKQIPKEVTYAEDKEGNFNNFSGRSPRYQRRGNYNSYRSGGNYNPHRGGNSNSRYFQRGQSQDRMKNFLARKREEKRNGADQQKSSKDESATKASAAEESCAVTDDEFDYELCAADTTTDLYEEFREQEEEERWEAFCALKKSGN